MLPPYDHSNAESPVLSQEKSNVPPACEVCDRTSASAEVSVQERCREGRLVCHRACLGVSLRYPSASCEPITGTSRTS